MYFTVLGTSAECGDSGQVGRGNRANGIIAVNRPMSAEAVAGKNPVSHVGKIYAVLSTQIAHEIHDGVEGIKEATVWLGSKIGNPVSEPHMINAQIALHEGASLASVRDDVEELIAAELRQTERLVEKLARGEFVNY